MTLELHFNHCDSGYKRRLYQCLQREDLLPHLRTLVLTDELDDDSYLLFLTILCARHMLAYIELSIRSTTSHIDVAFPTADTLAGFQALVDEGREIRITTPNHLRTRHIQDPDAVGNLGVYFNLGSNLVLTFFQQGSISKNLPR